MDEVVSTQNNSIEPTTKKGLAIKTLVLILVLAILAAGLTWLALSPKPKENNVAAVPTVTPDPIQTVLTVSSIPTPLATPSSYQTDVVINTGSNKVNSVQLELTYDPKVLTKVDIISGQFFVDPLVSIKNVDQVNGRISFVLNASGPKGSDNGVLGQGIVAQIRFSTPKGLKATNTSISFLPKTQVLGVGFSNSLLKTTVDASFVIGTSVIPTRIPTATPTATLN